MAVRHRTPSEDLEPAILEAAEALLEEGGPGALSVRGIAERAGVAPMGLYSRFEGKSGVVDALFRSGFEELEASIRSSHQIPDPLEGFVSCGRSYRALGIGHPARYQVMFMCAVPGFIPSDASHQAAGSAFAALAGTVQRCLDAGVFREGDPVQLAQQVWASCHGWVALELLGITFVDDLEGGYAELLEMLAIGLSDPSLRPSG